MSLAWWIKSNSPQAVGFYKAGVSTFQALNLLSRPRKPESCPISAPGLPSLRQVRKTSWIGVRAWRSWPGPWLLEKMTTALGLHCASCSPI